MSEPVVHPLPWVRRMSGRDPTEPHRASTPLELLFDLTFVVAVARAGIELRDALALGQAGLALARYAEIFFGWWWAWMNFTWLASAYETDDVPYRLLTLLRMAGVLVFAAGIPAAFEHFDLATVVTGYVIMRLALVAQWLRAARGHPEGRAGTPLTVKGHPRMLSGPSPDLAAPSLCTFPALAVADQVFTVQRQQATLFRGEGSGCGEPRGRASPRSWSSGPMASRSR